MTDAGAPRRLDYDELASRLAQRVDQLVPVLLPGALCLGAFWRAGSFAGGPGTKGGSLGINRRGRRQGMWCEFNGTPRPGKRFASGNMLQLIDEVRFGGSNIVAAANWAASWLGDPVVERTRPAPQRQQQQPQRWDDRPFKLWLGAEPLRPGDPVWRYLAGRGIDLSADPFNRPGPKRLRRPGALRYHPRLWHSPTESHWPAMVAAVCNAEGKAVAIHRTWLEIIEHWEPEEYPSDVRKAPVPEPKMSWGTFRGGCIHLGRGASGRPWGQMPSGETLLLGEGIEDVLSGMQHYPEWRAAAGVSLSAMYALELPPQITTIAFLRQRDKPGSPAAKGAERVMDRFAAQGRRVLEHQLPVFVKDLNELDQKLHA